jgi:uncharacterized coiled-coil DUF342 family protein
MAKTAQEVEAEIAEIRAEIEGELAEAICLRDEANERVKRCRERLDAAPRLHVKRQTKKSPGRELADAMAEKGA